MDKEKIIVGIIAIIVMTGAIFTGVLIKKQNEESENSIEQEVTLEDEVSDECTEEYKISMQEQAEEANSSQEKVSTNAILILKKYYKKCEHTINEYVEMPTEFVNMTEEEIKAEYPEWEVIGFTSGEVILYKEIDETCDEHFLLKIEEGKLVIYKILENGETEIYEKTDISTEYLPEVDLLNIEGGLQIYGKESLNQILEDFE